jgi:uncharacterized protein YndB with AHSA1/START domain
MISPAASSGPSATSTPTEPSLRVERHFRASPARVFRAWTSVEELNAWSDPEPALAESEIDLRVGGRYAIAMARPNGVVHRVSGIYREVDPPRRLVYSWRWETIPNFPDTVVTVEFNPRDDGGTDLVLVHEGLPSGDSGQRHLHGWTESLRKLASVVE